MKAPRQREVFTFAWTILFLAAVAGCSQESTLGVGRPVQRLPKPAAPVGDQASPQAAARTPPNLIDLTRTFTPVWGVAHCAVSDTRRVVPQVLLVEWNGKSQSVNDGRDDASDDEGDRTVPAGVSNDLPLGAVAARPRAWPDAYFPGLTQNPRRPPDCTLAVGPQHIVQTVNSIVAWFSKSGSLLFSQRMDTSGAPAEGFFEPAGAGNFCFDPRCFYDHFSQRFVVLALEHYQTAGEAWIDLAVSDDDDPDGTWYLYRTNSAFLIGSDTYWQDYPGFGFDKDAFYVTGNLYPLDAPPGTAGAVFRVFPKAPLLSGGTAVFADIRDPDAVNVQVAAHFGTNNPAAYFTSVETTSSMRIHAISDALTTPVLDYTIVTVPTWTAPTEGSQIPGIADYINTLSVRVFNCMWRDDDLYFAHTVRASGTRNMVRWSHLNTNSWPLSGAVTFNEAGNIDAGSPLYAFFPAVVVDRCLNVGVVLGTSSGVQNPDIRITGRRAGDSPGTMGSLTTVQSGPNKPPDARWGDYFGTALDPSDQTTFWYVGEYQQTGTQGWGTFIGSFKVGCHADYDCDSYVTGVDYDTFAADFELGLFSTDYNGDGFVTGDDMDLFLIDFIEGC